jgi:Bacterial archaeo-eukaryotic release factor family 10
MGEREAASLLRALVGIDASPWRVLSLYLDVQWRSEQQRERARLFVKRAVERRRAALGDGEADAAEARDLLRLGREVEERVRQAVDPGDRGLALFLCGPIGLDLVARLAAPPPAQQLATGSLALVRPLAVQAGEGRGLVVAIDRDEALVAALDRAGWRTVATLASDVPKFHKRGGWSQLGIQNARDQRLSRFEGEVAAAAAAAWDARPNLPVVLIGLPELLGPFAERLPARVRARVVRIGRREPRMARAELERLAVEALEEQARAAARERLAAIADEAGSGGRGALGLAPVLLAANAGRLRDLWMASALCSDGWRCSRCREIGAGVARVCAACGGPVAAVEVGDALVHRAVEDAAVIEEIPRGAGELVGGVAAGLRF